MNSELHSLESSFVFSCNAQESWGFEQFIPEHVLAYQISGETHIYHQKGTFILKPNQVLLVHKNQLAKTFKTPAKDREYKAVSILLKEKDCRAYAELFQKNTNTVYTGTKNIVLKPNSFVKSYFDSLVPYLASPSLGNPKMMFSKITEAIDVVLYLYPELESFFFDFSVPHKINLEKFMLQNYQYNTSLESFARLTGRSLATFKRDFKKIFGTTPAKWLKEKRLEEAYQLIRYKNKRAAEIYIDLGFENLSHFYTSFKKKYDMTPSQSLRESKTK